MEYTKKKKKKKNSNSTYIPPHIPRGIHVEWNYQRWIPNAGLGTKMRRVRYETDGVHALEYAYTPVL